MVDALVDGGMSEEEATDYYDDEMGGDDECIESAKEEMKDPAENGGIVRIGDERRCVMKAEDLDDALECIDELDSEE